MQRLAVVTGASRGIGAAIARQLAVDGYMLALVATDSSALRARQHELELDGATVEVHRCDLTDRSERSGLVAELQRRHPVIDVLVNNAGFADNGPVSEQGGAVWDQQLEIHLTAPFDLIRSLQPQLERAGAAAVVNIGSVGGILARPGLVAYGTAKAALHHLTRALAVEYGPIGIRINALALGSIRTEPFQRAYPAGEPERLRAAANPLGRIGTPEEVAAVVSFLCSPDSSYISGAVIPVDGAFSARLAVSAAVHEQVH